MSHKSKIPTRTVDVEITAEDIELGQQKCPHNGGRSFSSKCPLFLAAKRRYPSLNSIGVANAYFLVGEKLVGVGLTPECERFIHDADNHMESLNWGFTYLKPSPRTIPFEVPIPISENPENTEKPNVSPAS